MCDAPFRAPARDAPRPRADRRVAPQAGLNGTMEVKEWRPDGVTAEIDAISARGMPFGEEYFGNFFRSLFTLFQVLLGDSWSEVVARTLIFGDHWWTGLYFTSFLIINAVVLTNVVVAVLLEKVIEPPESEDDAAAAAVDSDSDEEPPANPKQRDLAAVAPMPA